MALEKGYYRDAGLDVVLVEGGPGKSSIQAVSERKHVYGVSSTGALIEHSYGKPIKAIGVIFQHSPLMLMSRVDTGIETIEGLRGKRVMLQRGYQNVGIIAALQEAGLLQDDYIRQDITYNVNDLINKNTDAYAVYVTNQLYQLDMKKIPYRIFNPNDQGIDFYGDIVITSDEEVQNHPERVHAFMQATSRGWRDALEQSDAAIDLILLKYNTQNLTREHLQFEARETQKFVMQDLLKPGYMNMFRWQRIANVYADQGLLPADYPLDEFVYLPPPTFSVFIQEYLWQLLLAVMLLLMTFLAGSAIALRRLVRIRTRDLQCEVESRQKVENRLNNLMNDMEEVYFKVNLQGELLEISDSVYAMAGYQVDELIGQPVVNLYANTQQREDYLAEIYKLGSVKSYELELRNKAGVVQCISLNSRLIYDENGEPMGMEGLFYQITEKKESERALKAANIALQQSRDEAVRANEAKTEFLAVMSHELRTPLHGIIGMHDLLSEMKDMPVEQQHNLAAAQQAAQSLRTVVSDILDLSKVEAGAMELMESEVELEFCLRESMVPFVFSARQKQLQFHFTIKSCPKCITVDSVRLRQILFNLVGNAVKFTQHGHVLVDVRVQLIDGERRLLFVVKDSGIGMSEKDVHLIFDAFYQVYSLMDDEHKGTGLGTTIVKRFVELMHGKLSVNSVLGKGSEFTFSIPYDVAESVEYISRDIDMLSLHAKPSLASPVAENVEVMCKWRVLLAEDDPISQRIGSKLLQRVGMHVDVADNGHDAVKMASKHDYQMILMDIRMPGMDGIEATRKIRLLEAVEKRNHVPILGLSAHALEEVQQSCKEAGMDDFLTKPFDSKEVLARMKHQV